MEKRFPGIVILLLLSCSCSRMIYPDRTQFISEGESSPTIALDAYRSVQLRPDQDEDLALVLCISGGGARAANLGMGILWGLEEIGLSPKDHVLNEVDYFSTVSGGGFAAGAYLSARYDHLQRKTADSFSLDRALNEFIRDDLKRSYVWPLVKSNVNIALLFTPIDDGDALEKAIDNHVLGYRRRRQSGDPYSLILGDLFVPAESDRQPTLPMHITNSSTVLGVRIFPFVPNVLKAYQINGYSHRMRRYYADQDFDPFSVPLAVGIKASGSFPVLISNSTLRSTYHPERRFLHLMDGALSDNLGIYTALDIIKQENTSRKALFVVDAEADNNLNTFSKNESAIWSFKVAASLPGSGLYARKAILTKEFEDLIEPLGVEMVYFGFQVLLWDNDALPPSRIDPKEEYPRLLTSLRKKPYDLSLTDRQILYELLTAIATKYSIKKDEQELLLRAGRLLAHLQRDAILRAWE
jgi:hypothetical protein